MENGGGELFEKACELAGVPKTRRQFKKFTKQRGAAYKHIHEARRTTKQ